MVPKKTERHLNEKFGRLEIFGFEKVQASSHARYYCLCRCECGGSKVVPYSCLVAGKVKSCGCMMEERVARGKIRAEQAAATEQRKIERKIARAAEMERRTAERERIKAERRQEREREKAELYVHAGLYNSWHAMKLRCYNPRKDNYDQYGGRGIVVCDEWRRSFVAFARWGLANGWREGMTIDRIDPDGNYEPGNCRWATKTEQQRNRRNTRWLTIDGQRKTQTEWCEVLGVKLHNYHSGERERVIMRKYMEKNNLPPVGVLSHS